MGEFVVGRVLSMSISSVVHVMEVGTLWVVIAAAAWLILLTLEPLSMGVPRQEGDIIAGTVCTREPFVVPTELLKMVVRLRVVLITGI